MCNGGGALAPRFPPGSDGPRTVRLILYYKQLVWMLYRGVADLAPKAPVIYGACRTQQGGGQYYPPPYTSHLTSPPHLLVVYASRL